MALQNVRQLKPDAVLLDREMPEMSGLETLRRLNLRSTCKVVILSLLVANEDSAKRIEALRLGAVATISDVDDIATHPLLPVSHVARSGDNLLSVLVIDPVLPPSDDVISTNPRS